MMRRPVILIIVHLKLQTKFRERLRKIRPIFYLCSSQKHQRPCGST